MIVGISGAQGGGKSSLLNKLKEWGYKVDDFRVSRAVQAELGWDSLERVMDTPDTMMAFQEQVFKQKLKNDGVLAKADELVLTERTFADIYAYTCLWMGKFIQHGVIDQTEGTVWLADYRVKCLNAQIDVYSGTLLLPLMPHIVFENDPHRAKQEDAEKVYKLITRFTYGLADEVPFYKITQESVVHRATEVEHFLKVVT